MEQKHFYGIDYLRTIACVSIVMMHMAANNKQYVIDGQLFHVIVGSFTNFVFLFMTISGFGLCVGYYEKVLKKEIDWVSFYKKRYSRILPFFALLVVLDIIVSPSLSSLIEGFFDVSLLFGLFPNDISVIGVGWFLGIIFAFYLIFPFFCFLIHCKKMAWFSFGVSLLLNYFCHSYYGIGRHNIVYCLPFFIAGGLIFLYIDKLCILKWYFFLPISIISIILYYVMDGSIYNCLLVSVCLLIQVILVPFKGLSPVSSFMIFFSGISMEIYLSHMLIFRIIEKLRLNNILGNHVIQYIMTVSIVLSGSAIFSLIAQKALRVFFKKITSLNQHNSFQIS